MRTMIAKKNYRLNEHALNKKVGQNWVKIDMIFPDEKSIFNYLKIPYIKPSLRSASYLRSVLSKKINLKSKIIIHINHKKIKLIVK